MTRFGLILTASITAMWPLAAGAITAEDFQGFKKWGCLQLDTQDDNLGIFEHHENLLFLKGKKVLLKIPGYYMVEKMEFLTLTDGHFKDLKVDLWDQVAQCCMDSIFLRIDNGKPHVLFRYSARGYDIWFDGAKDLNGDGNKEIVAAADVLTLFDDMCMACRPPVYIVIGFDGKRWREMTSRFQNEVLRKANDFKQEVLKLEKTRDWSQERPLVNSEIYSNAVGYLGNMMQVRDNYHEDLDWLRRHIPKAMFSRLKTSAPNLFRRVRSARKLVHQK